MITAGPKQAQDIKEARKELTSSHAPRTEIYFTARGNMIKEKKIINYSRLKGTGC